jgi:L-ascorbate metabolism protein UlaG (beta-lactamase superfamily)
MPEITYIRASTLLINCSGLSVLTDPWFKNHLRGLPCFKPPGIPLDHLPGIDVVLASHLHPDHYDVDAVKRISARARLSIIGPRGIRRQSRGIAGAEIIELVPWEGKRVGDTVFTATEASHSGVEVNFVIESGERTLFFGGDCKFSGAFEEIRRRFRVDIAMLPIGGTRVLGRRIVMGPQDALRAARILGAAVVIPIHEGGIWMSVPPLSLHPGRPQHLVDLVRHEGVATEVVVLRTGQSVRLKEKGARVYDP